MKSGKITQCYSYSYLEITVVRIHGIGEKIANTARSILEHTSTHAHSYTNSPHFINAEQGR